MGLGKIPSKEVRLDKSRTMERNQDMGKMMQVLKKTRTLNHGCHWANGKEQRSDGPEALKEWCSIF